MRQAAITETDTLRLGQAVILSQVSVRFHAKRTSVLMSEPTRDSRNIDAAFDANGREKVAEIVMSDSLHSDLRRCVRHAF